MCGCRYAIVPSLQAYNLTARVNYAAVGLSDTAAVTVWIREINKPSVFQGLFNASSGAPIAAAIVSEAALPGTAIGKIAFTDPNTAFPWNVLSYALLNIGPGAGFFAVNSTTGVVTVAPPAGGLNYWDYTGFTLTVACSDLGAAPLTTQATFNVQVTQVNTVSIASFGLPATTAPSAGQTSASGAIAFTTAGGTVVEINGTGFGPTARRLATDPSSAVAVTATYGLPAAIATFTASNCIVFVPNTVVRCTTAPGDGTGHAWAISVQNTASWNATSIGTATTSYLAPAILGVNKWAGTGFAPTNRLATAGGETVAVDGTNLAYSASESDLVWSYGPLSGTGSEYNGACAFASVASRVICTT